MGIGLVSHVPDQLVFGKVEDPVHGDGQLDYPQVGGQVASVFAGLLDQKSADLSRQKLQLAVGQPAAFHFVPGPVGGLPYKTVYLYLVLMKGFHPSHVPDSRGILPHQVIGAVIQQG